MQPGTHMVNIFLSYRRKQEIALTVRDGLKKQCDERGFNLVYDDKDLQIGESLVAFMNETGAARCIVLFLSPEYFQSAYTLYELIRLNEYSILDQIQKVEEPDLEKRFIFPVRLTENMDESVITITKNNFWLKEEAKREVLCKRLVETDQDLVWQRVLAAWNNIIDPFLDDFDHSLEEAFASAKLDEKIHMMMDTLQQGVDDAVNESQKHLQQIISKQLTGILEQQPNLK